MSSVSNVPVVVCIGDCIEDPTAGSVASRYDPGKLVIIVSDCGYTCLSGYDEVGT